MAEGPLFSTILNELLDGRLAGKLKTVEDEIAFIRNKQP
jgi:hypothetical protein